MRSPQIFPAVAFGDVYAEAQTSTTLSITSTGVVDILPFDSGFDNPPTGTPHTHPVDPPPTAVSVVGSTTVDLYLALRAPRLRVVGTVPEEGPGVIVRAVEAWVQEAVAGSPTDYWTVDLGALPQEGFQPRAELILSRAGLPARLTRLALNGPVSYTPGETIAVRVRSRGTPARLKDLNVVIHVGRP